MNHTHAHHSINYKKGYLVLATIILLITGLSLLSSIYLSELKYMYFMQYFMAYFFLVFGAFKLSNLKVFAITYSGYDLIAKRFRSYGYVYPFVEIALGLAYFFMVDGSLVNVITLILMLVGAAGVAKELSKKNRIPCACLGNIVELPLTTVSLTENLAMAGMAALMIVV